MYQYQENLTDSLLLSIAFQLFHYVARCEDIDPNSLKKFGATIKTFQHGSTMKILDTANEIFNIDKVQKKGREIWGQSSAGKLMRRMDETLGLNIHKSKLYSSSADILEEIGDEEELRRLGEYSLVESK